MASQIATNLIQIVGNEKIVAYQVLARKWRPKSFDTLKGQMPVIRALMNSIGRGQYHHAYLFTGTRGVGKTTIARILAKAFNCEQGVTANPCGQCSACQAIEAGRFVDLLEIDAASRTRVEDTRELLDNVQYAPTQGRFKIYLIDEVHMLSGHSFNALLKTLEEPPEHVIFILATTDPERIPVTVLSRCLRFNLKALSIHEIVEQLQSILEKENITYDMPALEKLARLAQGSMRDALSLLEQALAFSDGQQLQTQEVEDMLGIGYERLIPGLLQAIVETQFEKALAVTQEMSEQAADFDHVCASLLKSLITLSTCQALPQGGNALLAFADVEPSIHSLKDKISAEELQLLYQIGLQGRRDLRYAPDPKTGFDMIVLRMIAFRPGQVSVVHSQPAVRSKPEPQRVVMSSPSSSSTSLPTPASSDLPKVSELAPPQAMPTRALTQEKPSQENRGTEGELNWSILVENLSLSGLSAVLVKHCVVASWEGQKLALTLEAAHKACLNEQRQQQIQQALSDYFGKPIRLTIAAGAIQGETPSMQRQAALKEREEKAVQSIQQDSMVKNILSAFDAEPDNMTITNKERI